MTTNSKQVAMEYIAEKTKEIRNWISENQDDKSFYELQEAIEPRVAELRTYARQHNVPLYVDAYELVTDYVSDPDYYESSSYQESYC